MPKVAATTLIVFGLVIPAADLPVLKIARDQIELRRMFPDHTSCE